MIYRELEPEEIIIQDRQRKWFDEGKLMDLQLSIEKEGLLQLPIGYPKDGKFILIAGERRVRAMKKILEFGNDVVYLDTKVPPGKIPVAMYATELDALAAMEKELAENLKRVDLTWQEQTQAIAAIHSLRSSVNPSHTYTKTAEEVGGTLGTAPTPSRIKDNIIVARHLDVPEVASAKTFNEALRATNEHVERVLRQSFAAAQAPAIIHRKFALHVGDCREIMSAMPEGSFDVVLTDPPFGIGVHDFDNQSGRGIQHTYDDTEGYVKELIEDVPTLLTKITKEEAHLFLFCDFNMYSLWKEKFSALGWYIWTRPLIWVKNGGQSPMPYTGPSRTYETILFAIKGGAQVTCVGKDTLRYDVVVGKKHPAEKPQGLYQELLSWTRRFDGMSVLDPFCGGGTIFPAAKRVDMEATGIELDPATATIARERLESAL